MAKELREQLVDDFDGSEAVDTINFAVSGFAYEIDVSEEHRKEFWEFMEPWMKTARRQAVLRRPRRSGMRGPVWADSQRVRAWAKEAGLEVSDKGYPSHEVQMKFVAAYANGDLPDKYL
ncbi:MULTISPECIES: histone-like nucleoid-structuring protein Lsr2 [Streptosporangium]|uniref:Lsr2 family protein n=1 Tax=Streptosporangium brasiliense TaxID=47480 RepID=A0ABT9RM38_9ACTN|nr:Lsr2 family protein [Streptosporangium brasiliense]MDP9870362.1 hypothetical protein [Streptosporangium brasiliense]